MCRLENFNIINSKVIKSFDNILNIESNLVQATIWDIKQSDIMDVEFITKDKCKKRKINIDYRKKYISNLK